MSRPAASVEQTENPERSNPVRQSARRFAVAVITHTLSGQRWTREAGVTASGPLWDIGHSSVRSNCIVLSG
jgi:hypothetical protein